MNAITRPPARSKLGAIPPKATKPKKPKMLIFGKPGVGKTWASLDFPVPYYIDTEGGADLSHYTDKLEAAGGAYFGPDQGSLLFESILEQVKALGTENHHYKTLVIDSISKTFNSEIAREADRLKEAGIKNEYGLDRKPAVAFMRELCRWLVRMDMNVILIAHQKDEYGLNAKKEREVIGETFDCWDRLEYELHLCLHIKKAGPSRRASVRKSRLTGFADAAVFDWSYDKFAELYGRDVIEEAAEPVEVASPEQAAEVRRLLELVKTPDDWESKMLAKADVTTWEEMDAVKIANIIEELKKRITP